MWNGIAYQFPKSNRTNVEACEWIGNPDSKVPRADMGPTWVLSTPDGPYVGPMNIGIREVHTALLYWVCDNVDVHAGGAPG